MVPNQETKTLQEIKNIMETITGNPFLKSLNHCFYQYAKQRDHPKPSPNLTIEDPTSEKKFIIRTSDLPELLIHLFNTRKDIPYGLTRKFLKTEETVLAPESHLVIKALVRHPSINNPDTITHLISSRGHIAIKILSHCDLTNRQVDSILSRQLHIPYLLNNPTLTESQLDTITTLITTSTLASTETGQDQAAILHFRKLAKRDDLPAESIEKLLQHIFTTNPERTNLLKLLSVTPKYSQYPAEWLGEIFPPMLRTLRG